MLRTRRQVEDEAIGWVIRLRDAGDDEWTAFTAWLEADPAHGAAYEEAALADAEAEALVSPAPPLPAMAPMPANDEPARPGRRAFFGWAVAASLALVAGFTVFGTGGGKQVIETEAGERREIALEDGSRILLNASTRVVLDEDRPRFARLESGEALFRIVHDETRPFEVEAGDALLRDLGTVFNVVHEPRRLEVAVAEGEVLYNPAREAKHLLPGMALAKMAGEPLRIRKAEAEGVGAWRENRLVYTEAPLSRVAADLSRNLGVKVTVESGVASRPFSGVIMLDGEKGAVLQRASALLGLAARREGDGWILTRAGARS